jgi:hypothetical protein
MFILDIFSSYLVWAGGGFGISVGIETSYMLGRPGTIPGSTRYFSSPHFHSVQTVSKTQQTSYPKRVRGPFARAKWQGCEADHPHSSATVKKGDIPPFPHVYMV